ncbi:MAG: hypothetical protein ACRD44_01085 [Bryobacteraceae bacterium]
MRTTHPAVVCHAHNVQDPRGLTWLIPENDGMFQEAKEFLAGYWIVDVENAERATRRLV